MNDPTPKRLSICLAISGPNTGGGIERHVTDLASGLRARHRVLILAHESFEPLFDSNVEFHRLAFTRWRFNLVFLIQFWLKIRRLNPSIVHAHGRKAAQVVALTRRFFDAACILTVHNLSRSDRIARHFDSVIAVSNLVAEGIQHPHRFTVTNGCQ